MTRTGQPGTGSRSGPHGPVAFVALCGLVVPVGILGLLVADGSARASLKPCEPSAELLPKSGSVDTGSADSGSSEAVPSGVRVYVDDQGTLLQLEARSPSGHWFMVDLERRP